MFIEKMEGAEHRNIDTNLFNRLNMVGASEANSDGIDWWNVIGNGGEFVHYTTGVLVYLQKRRKSLKIPLIERIV
jgi:hypothetical protein